MKYFKPLYLIVVVFLLLLTTTHGAYALIEHAITVSVDVGQLQQYTLFGYTSSRATVLLEGIGISQQTQANQEGFYEFVDFLAPSNSKEFCLTNIDTEKIAAPPLCVAVPPNIKGRRFGPYLLPPTLQVTEGNIQTGRTTQLRGKTIPGTTVNLHIFEEAQQNIAPLSVIPKVFAAEKVIQKTESGSDGSFTTDLTSKTTGKIRLFAQASFNQQKTPKSTTLTINVFSLAYALLISILLFFKKLFNINTFIILQVIIVLYLLYRRLTWIYVQQHKKRAIVLWRGKEIIEYQNPDIIKYHS